LIGVLCVIAVYVSANIAYVHALSAPTLAATKTPAADVAGQVLGARGASAITILIVISSFGFLNLALLSAPRVYYAMAADGLFFKAIAKLSPRFHAPTNAILLQGFLAALFALTNTYDRLVSYAVFADWIFFALAGAALMVFRATLPNAPRPHPTPLYPLLPLLFIAAGISIVLSTFVDSETRLNAMIGAGIIAVGVPVYFLWKRLG
jgi:APA family basic amino acid/polyamine antiporter